MPFAQIFARDGAGRHPHDGLARRGASAAAVVAKAVLLLVGIVGMPGAKPILDLLVVSRALIFVFHQQTDRRAGGLALEHAGQYAHRIRLAALAGELRGSRAPAVNIDLQIRFAERESGRAAVDDATERGAVTLPKAGYRKNPAKSITRHA